MQHRIKGPIAAVFLCVSITFFATFLVNYFAPLNIVMIYLCGVVFIAYFFGRFSAFLASFLSVSCFDYFFVNPHFSIAVDELQYVFTFIVMFMVGILIGDLTARAKSQAEKAHASEQRALQLFRMANALSAGVTVHDLIQRSVPYFQTTTGFLPDIYLIHETGLSLVFSGDANSEQPLAEKSWETKSKSGCGVSQFFEQPVQYLPIGLNDRCDGVIAVKINDQLNSLPSELQQHLETQVLLLATAIERLRLTDENAQSKLNHETEQLRSTLLAGLSHDLRTPLTILFSQAEMLVTSLPLDDRPLLKLASSIRHQIANLTRLVSNILDMAKAESEGIQLRKEWQSLEEIIGSAIRLLQVQLETRHLSVNMGSSVPLIFCDAVLIERVISNVLENACKYSLDEHPITLTVENTDSELTVTIWNSGSILPLGQEDQLFNKFTRGMNESNISGVGLGLALCRSIIHAHQGTITAHNSLGGGVEVIFTLPILPMPRLESEENIL